MTDRRLVPDPAQVHTREPAQVCTPLVDLCRTPAGPRDRQLLLGDAVTVFARDGQWAYVQAARDGYCGYVRCDHLGPVTPPTHHVTAPATHAYAEPDFKSQDLMSLSFGSRVCVTRTAGRFAETTLGHLPLVHLSPMSAQGTDPAAVAAGFLGTPYLWGGNSRWGIDCSGLVQAALLACGLPCPGDSDLQQSLGEPATGGWRRNDLLFWKGHVALVTDAQTLIHANASAMSTVHEPIEEAIARIADQGDGPVTAHRRL